MRVVSTRGSCFSCSSAALNRAASTAGSLVTSLTNACASCGCVVTLPLPYMSSAKPTYPASARRRAWLRACSLCPHHSCTTSTPGRLPRAASSQAMNPCRTVSPCRYSSSRVLTSAFPGDCESNTAAMASPYLACMRRPPPVGGASSSQSSGIPSSDAAVRLFRFGEQAARCRGLERFGKQLALPEPAPERDEARALRDRLDALRNHAQTEVAGQVHDHPQPSSGPERLLPASRVPARLLEYPAADRDDEPGLLRQRHEVEREDHAALGVMPAQQRLEPVHAAALELHNGLEDQPKLIALEGVPQVRLHAGAGLGRVAHGHVEHLETRPPLLLGMIHGEVGVAQQILDLPVVRVAQRHADAGAREDLAALERKRRGERILDAPRRVLRVGQSSDLLEQKGKLIAPEPRHDVAGPHARP